MAQRNRSHDYELLDRIGKGAFGKVYKAKKVATNKIVAIKIINLEEAEDDVEDIQQEISQLSDNRCKQVVAYYESFLYNHKLWIVMEYLSGGSVKNLVNITQKTNKL